MIALQAEGQRSRYPSHSILEIAVCIFHDYTAKLLDFLRELLRLTIGPNAEEGEPFDTLREWVQGLLVTSAAEGTLVDQIIHELDHIHSRLRDHIRNRGPDFELLAFRVRALRADQSKLAGLLATISRGGMLGRGHVIKVLKWLKKSDRQDALVQTVLA